MAMTASVSRNIEKRGIEIIFSNNPGEEITDLLKQHKWKYHRSKHCWYKYYTPENMNFANRLKNRLSTKQDLKKKNRKKKLDTKYLTISEGKQYRLSHVPAVINKEDVNANNISKDRDWGHYQDISPKDKRYQKRRSFFS